MSSKACGCASECGHADLDPLISRASRMIAGGATRADVRQMLRNEGCPEERCYLVYTAAVALDRDAFLAQGIEAPPAREENAVPSVTDVGHAAEERAPVLYEQPFKKLVWHRQTLGYRAAGSRGLYTIRKRKPDRRHGVRPVVLSLDGAEVLLSNARGGFDTKKAAQKYAQKHDRLGPVVSPHDPRAGGNWGASKAPAKPFATVSIARDETAFAAFKARTASIGPIDSMAKVYKLIQAEMNANDQEVFVVVPLDVRDEPRDLPIEVARGQRSKVAVDVADVLRAALISGCESFFVAHLHPTGNARPSGADRKLTEAVKAGTEKIGGAMRGIKSTIRFRGHIVIGAKQWADASTGKVHRAS